MAYIRPLANGNFRADVRMKGIVKNKTFPTQKLAQSWADKLEHSIKIIPSLDTSKLLALSNSQIDSMRFSNIDKAKSSSNWVYFVPLKIKAF